jgi:hypothetical protein
MNKVVKFFKNNFAMVWLVAAGLYHLVGEKDISFTMLTLYIIEDVCDRIEWGFNKSKSQDNIQS